MEREICDLVGWVAGFEFGVYFVICLYNVKIHVCKWDLSIEEVLKESSIYKPSRIFIIMFLRRYRLM